MDIFICNNIFVPLRTEPSHTAEQDSQILFGERYSIVSKAERWIKIRTLFDGIEGWIDGKHEELILFNEQNLPYTLSNKLCCKRHNENTPLILEAGSDIFNVDFVDRQFSIGKQIYDITDNRPIEEIVCNTSSNMSIAHIAMQFVNTPYLWGGRSMLGIDCSGLVQTVMKIKGVTLPRNASQQIFHGRDVSFCDAIEGDVAFFKNNLGKICHVGIILSNNRIIHASGRVKIDTIDKTGIYCANKQSYSHSLQTIKRFV